MKLKWKPPVVVPVEGQLAFNGRVHLIAAVDMPKHHIVKGQKVGKTMSKKAFFALGPHKTITL